MRCDGEKKREERKKETYDLDTSALERACSQTARSTGGGVGLGGCPAGFLTC